MTTIPYRTVILNDGPRLGQPDGPHRFHLHWQYLKQLEVMANARWGLRLKQIVSAGQAKLIADMIDEMGDDPAWTPSKRRAVRAFVGFLRRGGFAIIKQGKRKSQRAAIVKFVNHS